MLRWSICPIASGARSIPQPVIFGGQGSGLDPTMSKVLLLCVIAVFCVMILVLVDRYRLELLRNECEELRFEIESRGLDSGRRITGISRKVCDEKFRIPLYGVDGGLGSLFRLSRSALPGALPRCAKKSSASSSNCGRG